MPTVALQFQYYREQTSDMHLSHRTIARSFSAELMDIFRIENSLTDLDQQVHDKLVYLHLLTV